MQTLPPHLLAVSAKFLGPTNKLGCRVKLQVPYYKDFTKSVSIDADGEQTLPLAVKYLETKGIPVLSFNSMEDEYLLHVSFDNAQKIKDLFKK